MRFSIAGQIVVALVVVSGTLNTALVLGRFPSDWSSPYEALLAAKIALVAAMVCVATVNRYVLATRLAQHQSGGASAIRHGIVAEIGLGLGVVGLVAMFGVLDPA